MQQVQGITDTGTGVVSDNQHGNAGHLSDLRSLSCPSRGFRAVKHEQEQEQEREPVKRVCQYCQASLAGRYWAVKYCSPRCKKLNDRDSKRIRLGRTALAVVQCPACGVNFKQRAANHVHCTTRCWEQLRTKKRVKTSVETYTPPIEREAKVEVKPPKKPRKRPMVETDTGRKCRPEELQPGEVIARFFIG